MPSRRSRTAAVFVVALATLLAACGGGTKRRQATPSTTTSTTASIPFTTSEAPTVAPPTSAAPKFTLNFTPCPSGEGFLCASAKPPLDYAKPDGPPQLVRVTNLPASGPAKDRIGTLFVNPGGPG